MEKFGAVPAVAVTPTDASPLHDNAAPQPMASGLSPQSPTFWLLAVVAATVGLVGFSTSGHVGPLRASVKV
jgi:hypothetical protein